MHIRHMSLLMMSSIFLFFFSLPECDDPIESLCHGAEPTSTMATDDVDGLTSIHRYEQQQTQLERYNLGKVPSFYEGAPITSEC